MIHTASRGERRARTERKVQRRMKQWKDVMGPPWDAGLPQLVNRDRVPGKGKKKSHLDCGKPGCTCGRNPPRPRHDERGDE